MRAIGGYFNLELSCKGDIPHADGVFLNTGRNSLEYVLRSLGNIQKVSLPYFTCEVILEPLLKLQIEYEFYSINEKFELVEDFLLAHGEYLIYTNYFGIKDSYVRRLAVIYGMQLIVDNAQAFYTEHIPSINTIYSPRKFLGLPDGGIAYANGYYEVEERDISYDRCSHLLKRYDLGATGGYDDFHANSAKLKGLPIRQLSYLTEALMYSVDYEKIKEDRKRNFEILHTVLGDMNLLNTLSEDQYECPMVYPYYSLDIGLRKKLIENGVYVAIYWPNVFGWCESESIEYKMAKNLIPIPIDQRYDLDSMEYILNIIQG